MKFTVERVTLVKIVKLLARQKGTKGKSDQLLRLSACQARVFVSASDLVAGTEALVFEDGACSLPRMMFLELLQSYSAKTNVTIEANESLFRVESTTMKSLDYSPHVQAPAEFNVFPVTDVWITGQNTAPTASESSTPSKRGSDEAVPESMPNDDVADNDAPEDASVYILNAQDRKIVATAVGLLLWIVRSSIPSPKQLVVVKQVLSALQELPRLPQATPLSVSLHGPNHTYGEHKIRHWWTVSVEPHEIRITSGGYFYRKSTGGDSFTCLDWFAQPGFEADYNDYWQHHQLVDDAQPFEQEVAKIDLSEAGYSLDVTEDGESVNDEADSPDEAEPDTTEAVEPSVADNEHSKAELVVNLWTYTDQTSGMVYAVAAKAYALTGTDAEKLAFLRQMAATDHLTVKRQGLPKNFSVSYGPEKIKGMMSPGIVRDNIGYAFEDVFKSIEAELPPIPNFITDKHTPQRIPHEPLYVLTSLIEDDAGQVTAITSPELSRKFAIQQKKRELMQELGLSEEKAERLAQDWANEQDKRKE